MDKMIQKGPGDVVITNDGATILSQMQVFHPTAQMLVQLSKSQDIEAGDGTTGICVIAGALLNACAELLNKDAVLAVIDPKTATNCDLSDVKIVKQVGGTMEDSELVHDAKIALIQFCLSAPKTDMENNVVVSDYAAMDRILREERKYLLNLCKKIKKSGCNVLLIQKSILRDAYNDLSLHFFLTPEKLGSCIENMGRTVTILMRGSNKLRFMIAGGGAPEAECALELTKWSKTLTGVRSYCARSFAEALEIIPYTLAENAGISPIRMVTELRARHEAGDKYSGINVKNGTISNMFDLKVVQPLLVNTSEIGLSCECVGMILKIDDLVPIR
eukprot:GSChrysophyteH1.ASY1.ANO1.2839.1 assembled CDS